MTATRGSNHPGGPKAVDKVRRLQRRLCGAAKRSPDRRFHALYDHLSRCDVLWEAWKRVRSNSGAAGVDKQTLADIEQSGVEAFLEGIAVLCARERIGRRWFVANTSRRLMGRSGRSGSLRFETG
jgi:hypothetical protein